MTRIDIAGLVEHEVEQFLDGAVDILRNKRTVVEERALVAESMQLGAQLLAEGVKRISLGSGHHHLADKEASPSSVRIGQANTTYLTVLTPGAVYVPRLGRFLRQVQCWC